MKILCELFTKNLTGLEYSRPVIGIHRIRPFLYKILTQSVNEFNNNMKILKSCLLKFLSIGTYIYLKMYKTSGVIKSFKKITSTLIMIIALISVHPEGGIWIGITIKSPFES